jgi:hypothetical protein
LVYGNGSHLIKEPLETTVLRKEQREELDIYHHQDWTTDEQREQLENHHREDWTTDSSRRNERQYSFRPFGTNSLMEGAV